MKIDWAFNQAVQFKKLTGHDGWGNPVYASPVPLKVWWSAKQRLIKAANGEEKMSEGVVKTPLSIEPQENDIFTYQGKDYRVLNAGTPPDIYGNVGHRAVFVEKAVQ